jgi:hypothetical protein
MPDASYKPEGTFYILLDLSDLIGQPLNQAARAAVGKKERIETDQDICYHLMFEEHLMICPGSYFGLDTKKGFLRVTCSGGDTQLNKIMDRIAAQISIAREAKKKQLLNELAEARKILKQNITNEHDSFDIACDLMATIKELLPNPLESAVHIQDDMKRRDSQASDKSNSSSEGSSSDTQNNSASASPPPSDSLALTLREKTTSAMKDENKKMSDLLRQTRELITKINPSALQPVRPVYTEKHTEAAVKIQKTFRGHSDCKAFQAFIEAQKEAQKALEKLAKAGARFGSNVSTVVASRQADNKITKTVVSDVEITNDKYVAVANKK